MLLSFEIETLIVRKNVHRYLKPSDQLKEIPNGLHVDAE